MGLDNNLLRRINNLGFTIKNIVPSMDFKNEELLQNKNTTQFEWQVPYFSAKNWKKASNVVDRMVSSRRTSIDPLK